MISHTQAVSRRVLITGLAGSAAGQSLAAEPAPLRAIAFDAFPILDPRSILATARSRFAEKGDLPLDKAKRYSGRVRIAYVSHIPESKQALMDARLGKSIVIKRRETTDAEDLAAAEKNLEGQARAAAKSERIEGLKGLSIGPDGRPRAQLSL